MLKELYDSRTRELVSMMVSTTLMPKVSGITQMFNLSFPILNLHVVRARTFTAVVIIVSLNESLQAIEDRLNGFYANVNIFPYICWSVVRTSRYISICIYLREKTE